MEIEKALPSKGESGLADGGTDKRSSTQLLKFLSDNRPEGVYVVATCNNISSLPPEWVRPGRWDSAPFFIDLPNDSEKQAILDHYKVVYEVDGDPDMDGWAGAEIESACRIAKMMGVTIKEASKYIKPVSKTMSEDIDSLRKWAKTRTIPSSTEVVVATKVVKRTLDI